MLEHALRQALLEMFPALEGVRMTGYRVRTLNGASCANAYGAAGDAAAAAVAPSAPLPGGVGNGGQETYGVDSGEDDSASVVRVLVECAQGASEPWRTVAVSSSVLDAFVLAYSDALVWRLLQI